ncbi:MAG: DUF4280 domain-containing protein [Flavobacteriaceae bacterium]|nr:DUF4280 domain-containing protein [Flavobacteriaceae bacterium]
MARRHYLVEGGKLQCDKGSALGEIIVTSQQKVKIQGKYKATSEDKTFKPPFFGSCACANNSPCSPVLQEWKKTSKKSRMGDKTFVMKNSQIQCSKGGMVTVKDVGQTLVGTGKDEPELDKKYAKFQGEIIFANGYFSESLGGIINALYDVNPDKNNIGRWRGKNVDKDDKISDQDLITHRRLAQIEAQIEENKNNNVKDISIYYPTVEFEEVMIPFPMGMSPMIPKLAPLKVKIPKIKTKKTGFDVPSALKSVPWFSPKDIKSTFWGYWNDTRNKLEGSNTYANHFNAGRNQNFLNGSHGLGSNAAHRIDHGIAQGYHWAEFQWGIIPKEEVDDTKEKVPYIKTYSPAYKPITIVMHSQGNAPGVGFALGAMKYANELGWEQIPLNLIFLGVHQPQNLWEDEYEKFINAKVKYYGVNKDFWDGVPWSILLKRDKDVHFKFSNALSDLFDPKHHKLRSKRGIYEHLQAITGFDALKERSVQFTFSNDRPDLTCRDGDIPGIDSACRPKRDTTLYSVEYFSNKAPERYGSKQGKEIISVKNGGQLVIPSYAAIPRIEVEKDKETGEEKLVPWKDYRSIALDWANAFSMYKQLLKKHKLTWKDVLFPASTIIKSKVKNLKIIPWRRAMLFHYGRIQVADIYAHFSPVGLINNDKILKTKDFNDGLGNENIWERIKKTGEQKFYRVEYETDDDDEMTEEAKRKKAKKYVEGTKGQKHLINTSIADTPYISNVIKAYVHGDTNAEEQLYKEPVFSDKKMEKIQKMLGVDIKKYQEELLKEIQVKQDNTRVVKPIIKKP